MFSVATDGLRSFLFEAGMILASVAKKEEALKHNE